MGWPFPAPHGDQDAAPTKTLGLQALDIVQVMPAGLGSATGSAGSSQKAFRGRAADVFKTVSAVAAGNALWTPGSTRAYRLLKVVLMCGVAGNVVLTDGNGGATVAIVPLAANVPTQLDFGPTGILSPTGAATPLYYAGGGPGAISGMVMGVEE